MTSRTQAIDLDLEDGLVILVGFAGIKRALDRQAILKLLALEAEGCQPPSVRVGRSLTSLGKVLVPIHRAGKVIDEDAARLMAVLADFDGHVAGKRSAQAGHLLRAILGWRSLSKELRGTITAFLTRYPELEAIPNRTRKGMKPKA